MFAIIFVFLQKIDNNCMQTSVLNPAQIQLLNMMSFVSSPSVLSELNSVVSDFFAKRAQDEIDRMWKSGELTEEKVESFRTLHERTPYK